MSFEIYDVPLFRGCDRSVVDDLLDKSPCRFSTYKKGDFVAMQNSVCRTLYLLYEGSVCLQMTSEEGREFTLDTLAAPDVLASSFIFGTESILPASIIANSECRFLLISRDCVLQLIERDKTALHNFLTILSDHSLFLSRKLEQFALQNLSSRLIGYLRNNHSIQNLQEAAFILGVTRPSLSRTVSQLARQGILRKTEKGYILS